MPSNRPPSRQPPDRRPIPSTAVFLIVMASIGMAAGRSANGAAPLADAHRHDNGHHAERLTSADAVQRLREPNVDFGVAANTRSTLARTWAALDPDRRVARFSPYETPLHRPSWHPESDR